MEAAIVLEYTDNPTVIGFLIVINVCRNNLAVKLFYFTVLCKVMVCCGFLDICCNFLLFMFRGNAVKSSVRCYDVSLRNIVINFVRVIGIAYNILDFVYLFDFD